MLRRTYIFLLLIVFNNIKVHGQLTLKEPAISYVKIDSSYFAIAQRPVTNKEYIIYLAWLNNVYSAGYPNIVYNSLPGLKRDTLQKLFLLQRKHLLDNADSIFKYSEPYIKEYMFNPKYLDYPVIGIKWQDANNYCKWLSDRYNEMILIRKGDLGYAPAPTENDFFYTELFIMGLWQGTITSGKKTYLKDDVSLFVPTFRLPTKPELNAAKNMSDVSSEFKAYPLTKNNVLYKWYKQYFSDVTDTSYIINGYADLYWYYPLRVGNCKNCKDFDSAVPSEEQYLDINNEVVSTNLIEIYKQNGQNRIDVDSIIRNCCINKILAPYIMIGQEAGKPIIVENYKDLNFPENNTSQFTFFRFACTVKESIKK